jgi:hypothetical protein
LAGGNFSEEQQAHAAAVAGEQHRRRKWPNKQKEKAMNVPQFKGFHIFYHNVFFIQKSIHPLENFI